MGFNFKKALEFKEQFNFPVSTWDLYEPECKIFLFIRKSNILKFDTIKWFIKQNGKYTELVDLRDRLPDSVPEERLNLILLQGMHNER